MSANMTRLLLLLFWLLGTTCRAEDGLESLVAGTAVTPALSGLQVSIMQAGTAADSQALGFAQRSDLGTEPLTRDHKVRIASISKLVVAIGLMQLVDQERVDLDVDVSSYLGWTLRNPAHPDTAITLRQLLAHTSSIRDDERYFIAANRGELKDFFDPSSPYWDGGRHFAPEHPAGSFFVYANLNFGLIGEVIERVSGQRFDQYMTQAVLAPLGITGSFNPCDIAEKDRAAAFRKRNEQGQWQPNDKWVAQVDEGEPRCFYGANAADLPADFLDGYTLGSNASLFSPQGGLRASSDDLIRVLRLLAGGGMLDGTRLLSAASVEAMLTPVWTLDAAAGNGLSAGEAEPGGPTDGLMTSYGLSVHRIDLRAWGFEQGPALLVGHLGEAYGVLSHALFDPISGDGIATIITGTANDPGLFPGHSPLYRIEEEVLRWWIQRRSERHDQ